MTVRLTPDEARARLVGHHGLDRAWTARGADGARALLARLRCIQLDPLDRIGTNADLVAHARIDDLPHGGVYDALLPGHAFEHFAKERCLLPADAFPHYRDQAVETPWWRSSERHRRLPAGVVEAVLEEVAARGPIGAEALTDHGAVDPIDWNGWKGTGRATTMALEVLWRQCRVVVHDRTPAGKRWAVPEVTLPQVARAPSAVAFAAWALRERMAAAGLLTMADGPLWSMLASARKDGTVEAVFGEGGVVAVEITGSRRRYLAASAFLEAPVAVPDDRMRVLAPLDPLLWDRKLVEHAFGFVYVWEVYKPAEQRRWGWYVCPLLHRGHLVGRVEAHVADGRVVVDRLWREAEGFEERAFEEAMGRLEAAVRRRGVRGGA